MARFLTYLANDVHWWELGAKRPIVGRLELEQHLSGSAGGEVAAEVHDVLTNDEHLVALIHASAVIGTETIDISYAEVLHFDDQGLVTKRQVFPSDIWNTLKLMDSGLPTARAETSSD